MKELMEKLAILIPKGFRSIGEWCVVISYVVNFEVGFEKINEHQKAHGAKCAEKYGMFILMKEAYNDMIRVHDPLSFASHVITQVCGAKTANEYTDDVKEIERLCLEILGYERI